MDPLMRSPYQAAHLVIDMQVMFINQLAEAPVPLPRRIEDFIEATQSRFLPVYVLTYDRDVFSSENWDKMSRGEPTDFSPALRHLDTWSRNPEIPAPAEKMSKEQSSAFAFTDMNTILTRRKIDTVILSGVNLRCCVWESALGARAAGYRTIILKDLCDDSIAFKKSKNYPEITAELAAKHNIECISSSELDHALAGPVMGNRNGDSPHPGMRFL